MIPSIEMTEAVGTPAITFTAQATPVVTFQVEGYLLSDEDDFPNLLKEVYRLVRRGEKSPHLLETTNTGTPTGCREYMVTGCSLNGKLIVRNR